MANHGYFPHSGVGGMSDFVAGTFNAFGMGPDLAEFLALYGAIFDGNLVEYSIGGPDPVLINAGGLLGEPMDFLARTTSTRATSHQSEATSTNMAMKIGRAHV